MADRAPENRGPGRDLRFLARTAYYAVRPAIPRSLQILVRRWMARRILATRQDIWPIREASGAPPPGWKGWPDGKSFALVLTHDVDTHRGLGRCRDLMALEEDLGFRSAFYFVAARYPQSPGLLDELPGRGFEVGVHGLFHDGKLFASRKVFDRRAALINRFLALWGGVGFRAPAMHHILDWIHDLRIEYDASTFEVDPFEPQPDGCGTVFPFIVEQASTGKKYVELPYTLPQDFSTFVLLGEPGIDLWKRKLDWLAEKGGMALMLTHPDYMSFGSRRPAMDEYPADHYKKFLTYVKKTYYDCAWRVLPKDMARYWFQRTDGK